MPFDAYHIFQLGRHERYLIAVLALLVLHIGCLYLQVRYQVVHSLRDRQTHGHQRTVQVPHERVALTAVGYQLIPPRQHRIVLHNQVLHPHIVYPDTGRNRVCRFRVILQILLHVLRHVQLVFHTQPFRVQHARTLQVQGTFRGNIRQFILFLIILYFRIHGSQVGFYDFQPIVYEFGCIYHNPVFVLDSIVLINLNQRIQQILRPLHILVLYAQGYQRRLLVRHSRVQSLVVLLRYLLQISFCHIDRFAYITLVRKQRRLHCNLSYRSIHRIPRLYGQAFVEFLFFQLVLQNHVRQGHLSVIRHRNGKAYLLCGVCIEKINGKRRRGVKFLLHQPVPLFITYIQMQRLDYCPHQPLAFKDAHLIIYRAAAQRE